jgi:hypothetical protein
MLCPHCHHSQELHTGPAERAGRADGGQLTDHHECGQCSQPVQNPDSSWPPCPCPCWYPGLTPMQLTAETIATRAMSIQLADAPTFTLAPPLGTRTPVQLTLFGSVP